MRTVSIVMNYYNRPIELALTLKSIEKYVGDHNIQIIIVDDASDDNKKALPVITNSNLDIELIEISKEEKTWKNPCIAYNIGFDKVKGDVVIIQNSECLHIGDMISYAVNNLTDKNYFTFSCFSINYKITEQIKAVWDNNFQEVSNILTKIIKDQPKLSNWVGWYNHIKYRPSAFHWLSAITSKNLKELGGFDERYAHGYSYDDNDLLLRIKIKELEVQIVSEEFGYAVHQQHPRVDRSTSFSNPVNQINYKLFFKLKAEYEKKYGKTYEGCH